MKNALIILLIGLLTLSCSSKRVDTKMVQARTANADNSLFQIKYNSPQNELELFIGYENHGGVIIYEENEKKLLLSHLKKEFLHIILLVKIKNGEKQIRQILDTLHFKSTSDNQNTDLFECEDLNDIKRRNIFGFYNNETEEEFHSKVVMAWKVDLESEEMIRVNTAFVKCPNLGYGL